jgi:hypothetical protein
MRFFRRLVPERPDNPDAHWRASCNHHSRLILPIAASLVLLLLLSCALDTPPAPVHDNPWDPLNPNPPQAPAAINARALNETELLIRWMDKSGNEDGFRVYESLSPDSTPALIATTPPDIDTLLLTAKSPATDFYYQVAAFNAAGSSELTDTIFASTAQVAPTAPESLSVQTVSATALELRWRDCSAVETSFELMEATAADFTSPIYYTLPPDCTSLYVPAHLMFTTYYYRIRAVNSYGGSAYTPVVSGTPGDFPPAAPSDLTGAALDENTLWLHWRDNSVNEESFELYQSINDTLSFNRLLTATTGITDTTLEGLTPAVTYYYKLRAANRYGESQFTGVTSVRTSETVPFPPTNLTASVPTETDIRLNWVDHSAMETGFEIEEWMDILPATNTYTSPADSISLLILDRQPLSTYHYRVCALGAVGNSFYTNEVTVIAGSIAPQTAPDSLQAEALSGTEILLTWRDRTRNEEIFDLEVKAGAGQWSVLARPARDTDTLVSTGRQPHTQYQFRIRARNRWGISAYSNTATVNTPYSPAAPGNLVAAASGAADIRLSWRDNSDNEEVFIIEERTQQIGAFVEIDSVGPGIVEYLVAGREQFVKYEYRVRARNWLGYSDYSNTAAGNTYAVVALVAASDAGLVIVNINDPTSPEQIASFDTPGLAKNVTVAGNYAYVADAYMGMRIIDISDPRNPTETGYFVTEGRANAIAVEGNYAYIADGDSGFTIIDISNPASPRELGFLGQLGTAYDIDVDGNYAYVAIGDQGMAVVNVSNRNSPSRIALADTPGAAYGLCKDGNYAYVADYSGGLMILNIATPSSPDEVGSADLGGLALDVVIYGDYAYFAMYRDGLVVANVSNHSAPAVAGWLDTPGEAWGVAYFNNYAFIADDSRGLRIISVKDPAAPQEVGSIGTPSAARGVAVKEYR